MLGEGGFSRASVLSGEATGQAVVWGCAGECMEYNVKGLPCQGLPHLLTPAFSKPAEKPGISR